jgi:lysozyme family protein
MTFEDALAVILKWEGGYSNHPQDPGGATNHGITLSTLGQWRGQHVTAEDVQALTIGEAGEIYRAMYWDKSRCGDMPAGVDLMLFDCAVNQGPGAAARLLQDAANTMVDGIIGPNTIRAVTARPQEVLIEFAVLRAARYAKGNPTFHLGWYRRLFDVTRTALQIV